jgi:hypothetical protein
MKIARNAIPYIYLGAGIFLASALILTGCANTGSTRTASNEQASADDDQKQACKMAIDDVTRFCAGDNASTGKCNDAKKRTRELCI